MPGTILSQFGTHIIASKQCARAIDSTLSAISSRLGREYFIPWCAIAIPSQTAMVLNSIGTPPASAMHFLRNSPTRLRWQCPGTKLSYELQMPMKGLLMSERFMPVAKNSDLCGARSLPFFT